MSQKQPKRGPLWLNDRSFIRLHAEYPGHVWSHDFVEGSTYDGRKYPILSIIDEASRECLALPVGRKFRSEDVLAALAKLFVTRGPLAPRSASRTTLCRRGTLQDRSPKTAESLLFVKRRLFNDIYQLRPFQRGGSLNLGRQNIAIRTPPNSVRLQEDCRGAPTKASANIFFAAPQGALAPVSVYLMY